MFLAYLTDAEGHVSDGVALWATGSTGPDATAKLRKKWLESYMGDEEQALQEFEDLLLGDGPEHLYFFMEQED